MIGARFVLVPQHFGSLVFDRRTSRYLPFDREATDLLRASVATSLGEVMAAADEARADEIGRFLEDFYPLGMFTPDLRFAGEVRAVDPPQGHLTGPLAVHLEVVAACNLACGHCFAGELPRREPALTLAELDGLFATLARVGAFRLGLTGGEPLLRRDLLDVIDLALSHGLHPCLTTNGLLLDARMARELGRRELVWLNVSLDGATAETNDRVRGAGTFDRVLDALRTLRQHARFTLAFTVMAGNAHEVSDFARLAERVGAHAAVLRPLYPVGTAARDPSLMPTYAQYDAALRALADATSARDAARLRGIDPFGPFTRGDTQARVFDNLGCGAGNTVCSISLGGDVSPCSFLGPAFRAANVRARSFEEIWREGHSFSTLRALPGDGAAFAGGCRARSLALAGDVNAPDPWLAAHATSGPGARHPLVVLDARRARP